jgi:hypothetical protein
MFPGDTLHGVKHRVVEDIPATHLLLDHPVSREF